MKTRVRAGWSHALLVCRKCAKRAGHAGLAKALRREPGFGKGRKAAIGVVEVGCLDICPKRGVVVVDTRTPGCWRILDPGTAASGLAAGLRDDQSSPGSLTGSPSVSRA